MKYQNLQSGNWRNDCVNEPDIVDDKIVGMGNQIGGIKSVEMDSGHCLSNSVVLQKDLMRNDIDHTMHTQAENFYDGNRVSESLRVIPGSEVASENFGDSKFVSPSIISSPGRHTLEGRFVSQLKISGSGLIDMAEFNNPNSPKQAFDQQQQDLVDAASKAISYRQEIMEENVRLTYALQPPVADAQSIVSNVKVLFRHLQEQLLITEEKLKESRYLLAPWRSDANPSRFAQSSFHPVEVGLMVWSVHPRVESFDKYLMRKVPSSDSRATSGDLLGRPQSGLGDLLKNSEHDALGEYPYIASRDSPSQTKLHQPDTRRQQNDLEPSANWTWKASEYPINLDDPNSSCSPYLPPVLEEPSSFFSEGLDLLLQFPHCIKHDFWLQILKLASYDQLQMMIPHQQ
ncbi:UNVERIFIED_CONTAM: hypothetical protein Slati_3570000 [Sesamum latifolium]|uniref:Uncharacterized protein n=1 Tax=Sesamum latifolium TaxID=2727402 RepID=A0AAW2UJN0_9LAMI